MLKFTGTYQPDQKEIHLAVKHEAKWECVRCGRPHTPGRKGWILTVHHLDGNKSNNAWWNTAALCERCHLQIQGKVVMERAWMFEHTPWFKPYVGGYFAKKYLGLDLTRAQVEANLDYYAGLEVQLLAGEANHDSRPH